MELIANGFDLDFFTPAKRAPLNLPGLSAADFVAGFTGGHGIAGGLDAVFNAAAVKRRRRDDVKLLVIRDGKCKDALVERVRREALETCRYFRPSKNRKREHFT